MYFFNQNIVALVRFSSQTELVLITSTSLKCIVCFLGFFLLFFLPLSPPPKSLAVVTPLAQRYWSMFIPGSPGTGFESEHKLKLISLYNSVLIHLTQFVSKATGNFIISPANVVDYSKTKIDDFPKN